MTGFLSFAYHQLTFRPQPLPPTVRLDGQTAIVTGSSAGLGFEAAAELAAHGLARLVLAVRSEARGEAARARIAAASPACDVRAWLLDQDDLADRARTQLDRLDIACLNAGLKRLRFGLAAAAAPQQTQHEAHVQVNHPGTALLSLLLLSPLRRTARATGSPSRLTITASSVAFYGAPTELLLPRDGGSSGMLQWLDDPASFGRDGSADRYNLSKLLNVLWMRALAARVDGAEDRVVVVINALNPGYCRSEFHRADPGAERLGRWVAWSAEQGAWHITDAATRHPDSHGQYLSEQRIRPVSRFVLSPEGKAAQDKLWNETLELFRKEVEGIDLSEFE
ncbi:hypothetical protein SLS62_001310 [Diatrype stigma]|uniref:Uncharacterized protein n=1 Tax=Diatrype stigma TaxID=117547 RepID=A0AAN9V2G2_9PEZI